MDRFTAHLLAQDNNVFRAGEPATPEAPVESERVIAERSESAKPAKLTTESTPCTFTEEVHKGVGIRPAAVSGSSDEMRHFRESLPTGTGQSAHQHSQGRQPEHPQL